jgi:dTDP-4-dehydrorhamnose reductase
MTAAKSLLVLGASGLTGYKSMQLAKKRFEAFGTFNMRKLSSSTDNCLFQMDITKEDILKKKINEIKPEIVLNTTALHNVDYCEAHPEEAFNINSKVVSVIARLCNNLGSRLIHISTDYVFDGEKGNYMESDLPNPQSVYAKSKLDGEEQAKKAASYSILRPSVEVHLWKPKALRQVQESL